MHFLRVYSMYLLGIIFLWMMSVGYAAPDCDFLMKAFCPKSRPYKCPPDAVCYSNEQYCTANGNLKSCFPHQIFSNETALLEWCRQLNSSSNLLDPTCQCACYSKFRERLCICDQVTLPTVNTVTNSSAKDARSCDIQEYSPGYILVILGLAVSVILNIVLCIVVYLRLCRTQSWQTPRVENAGIPGGANHMAGYNRQECVEDETEEAAATPLVDVQDNDMNRDNVNLPSDNEVDHVHSRSTNTQNRDPINQEEPVIGRGACIRDDAPVNPLVSFQGTRNDQNGQVRYSPQHTASFASTSVRRHNGETHEELAGLIPGNRRTEFGPAPTDHSINTSPTIPEAAGRHPNGTNVTNFE